MKKLVIACLLMASSLGAQTRSKPLNPHIDSLLPSNPTSYLTDMAGVVKNPVDVNTKLKFIRDSLKLSLVAVTMKTTGRFNDADVAREIGRKWLVATASDTIGSDIRNTGGVILLVMDTRKCRVEVATGSEGYLTDSRAAALCRDATNDFRDGNFDIGIISIADGFAEYHVENVAPMYRPVSNNKDTPVAFFIVIGIIGGVVVVLLIVALKSKQEPNVSPSFAGWPSPSVKEFTNNNRHTYNAPPRPSPTVEYKSVYTPSSYNTNSYNNSSSSDSSSNDSSSSDSSWSSGGSDSFSGGGGGSSW